MKSFRFSEWALGGLLALALIVAAGLVWFYWNQTNQSNASSQPQHFTAREAYAKAESTALGWESDARLVSASTTWNMDHAGNFTKFGWSLMFYSPSETATALISVSDQDISLLGSRLSSKSYQPADLALWELDSPIILEDLMSAVEPKFIESMGEATLTLTLSMLESPNWKASLSNLDSGMYFSLEIDARNGQTIDIEQIP